MPLISKITLPSGNTYDIKDAWARTQIEAITGGSAVVFKGVSSTALTDGGNENPTVNNEEITEKTTGELYFYGQEEFIYGGDNKWHSLGPSLSTLGELAYKDTVSVNYDKTTAVSSTFTGTEASIDISYTPSGTIEGGTFTGSNSTFSGSYTPEGTVSQPTFTGSELTSTASYTPAGTVDTPVISLSTAGSTTSINNPTSVTVAKTVAAAAPSGTVNNEITYYDITNQNLTLYKIGYTTGDSITTQAVTVKTGDASYESSTIDFTGTQGTITSKGTPAGTVSQPTFTGTSATINTSGTPSGSVSEITFTGEQETLTGTVTPAGTVTSTVTNTDTAATVVLGNN